MGRLSFESQVQFYFNPGASANYLKSLEHALTSGAKAKEGATGPQLARAVRKSLTMRGDYGTGFSMAWKMSLGARLRDGDYAHRIFRNLIEKQTCPNLFSICLTTPQVDGTFGACAGIAEMLLQSHGGQIHLLPALPRAWPNGRARGLRARGGFEVDLHWKDSRLLSATIRPEFDGPCKVRYAEKTVELKLRAGESYILNGADLRPENRRIGSSD